jgi:thioredoxin 1
MPKFGKLINLDVPILLDFYGDLDESSKTMHPVLRDVAAAIGDKGKVIKININLNNELSEALRIKSLPTLMIYKGGEMVWRQSGEQDANTLINLINDFI